MSDNEPPRNDELEDDSNTSDLLEAHDETSESIDLTGVFRQDLTVSGSFDARAFEQTSFGKLLQALPTPALMIERSGNITFSNEAWGRISRNYRDLAGSPFRDLFPKSTAGDSAASLIATIFKERKPKAWTGKLIIDERPIWARAHFRAVRLADARLILVLVEDLTLEKRQLLLMEVIKQAKSEWELTFDSAPDLIATLDDSYRIVRLNKAMAKRLGLSQQEAVGKTCYSLVHGLDSPPPFCRCNRVLQDGRERFMEYPEEKLHGFFSESVSPMLNAQGLITGCILVCRDITERKRLEDDLKHQATHDSLTDLLNQRQIKNLLAAACETAKRYSHPLSLCLFDLDRFKQVNDRYGHQVGDRVLVTLGEIVRQGLRSADLAGRYGGDEFMIAFPHTPASGANRSMERILTDLKDKSFEAEAETFSVTCTAGIAEFDARTMTVEDLIQEADNGLFEAKKLGRNRVVIRKTQN